MKREKRTNLPLRGLDGAGILLGGSSLVLLACNATTKWF
jgi:hypothetical protein